MTSLPVVPVRVFAADVPVIVQAGMTAVTDAVRV
jgi:hypothetical protein